MGGNQLRELLNRLRWDPDATSEAVMLCFRTRAAAVETEDRVPYADVAAVVAEGVVLADGMFLPYHRLTAVVRGREVLWRVGAEGETWLESS